MEQKLQKLLKGVIYQPERRLPADVWAEIESRKAHILIRQKIIYLSLSVLSLSGSMWSIKSLFEESSKLGFFNYLSLIFSDGGLIASYWKEYTLSLADSLPVASLFLTVCLLLILFISIRRTLRQFNNKLIIA